VARSLVSNEVIIALIANTTTQTGLKICAELDTGHYPTGLSVTDAELAALNLKRADFHGECNYTLLPLRRTK
jgi:Rhodopirellula transposase DDE domain